MNQPTSVNIWTRLAGFCIDNGYSTRTQPRRCIKSKLAYQARQVEVEQAVPRQLQQAGGQEEVELLHQEEGLGGRDYRIEGG